MGEQQGGAPAGHWPLWPLRELRWSGKGCSRHHWRGGVGRALFGAFLVPQSAPAMSPALSRITRQWSGFCPHVHQGSTQWGRPLSRRSPAAWTTEDVGVPTGRGSSPARCHPRGLWGGGGGRGVSRNLQEFQDSSPGDGCLLSFSPKLLSCPIRCAVNLHSFSIHSGHWAWSLEPPCLGPCL